MSGPRGLREPPDDARSNSRAIRVLALEYRLKRPGVADFLGCP